ncbi:MAG: CsbD family protein [Anaeromyxobacter sp.]|nr:CsbD family protein [Anaeromyxobacter sp.]MBL0277211.1 CsbD family protein [Anaeromyxobacter sp.]
MKTSTHDEAKGKLEKVKGTIKEATGSLLGKPRLEAEGKAQKRAGQAQEKVGQVEKVLGK